MLFWLMIGWAIHAGWKSAGPMLLAKDQFAWLFWLRISLPGLGLAGFSNLRSAGLLMLAGDGLGW